MDTIGRRRVAVAAVFAVHGAEAGTFATRIPWIKDHVHAGAGALGLALLAPAIGSLLAMPMVGRVIHRVGGRITTRVSVVALCAVLMVVPLAPNVPVLALLLLAHGAFAGSADVAMNAQGVEVERALGRPVMSGLHGMWSVGGLVGAAVGTLAAQHGVGAEAHFPVVAAVLGGAVLVISRTLPAGRPEPDVAKPPAFALPTRAVLGIGLVAFCAVFAEGAAANWCAVYLKDVAHTGAGLSAFAYTAFAMTMAASRLTGNRIVAALGAVRTVRTGGLLAACGGTLVVVARTPVPAIAGFALVGLGVALIVPLAFAAAGNTSGDPGRGVAGVATVIYTCLGVAPAIIGGLASATSLSVSFALVTAVTVVMALLARQLRAAEPAKARTAA